ncbi:MAG: DNA-binding protein [Sphingobacteriales bacterium]|nr:MAG: DNA-binding protein [Sphingobacteriales bacterium]
MEQLKAELLEPITRELKTYLTALQPTPATTEYLTRKEAATLLGVSLPTLNEWTKNGTVQGYRIASRVRYKRSELETSLSKIKTRRRAA